MARLVAGIRQFVEAHSLTGSGIVAVSGGPDSVALLHGLLACGVEGLLMAHFNHQLRGAESDRDEGFVRNLGNRLGVPVLVASADVQAVGGNLEATGRRLRYDWFTEMAHHHGAGWIATGHTADDQAETLLHRLIRGTGLHGLQGIAETRPLGNEITLIRPLLAVHRVDVLEYLAVNQIAFQTDSSNQDSAFTRNRIRHELLPLLQTFNPRIVEALGRLARQARELADDHAPRITQQLARCERPRVGSTLILDAEALAQLTESELRELFRLLWQREGWPQLGMTATHWQRLADIAIGTVSAVDFPGGLTARRTGKVVQIRRRA